MRPAVWCTRNDQIQNVFIKKLTEITSGLKMAAPLEKVKECRDITIGALGCDFDRIYTATHIHIRTGRNSVFKKVSDVRQLHCTVQIVLLACPARARC
jgi:hypothetical protein